MKGLLANLAEGDFDDERTKATQTRAERETFTGKRSDAGKSAAEVYQKLAITESTLTTWVGSVTPGQCSDR